MQEIHQLEVNKLIKIDLVSNLTSLGKSTILLWESQGKFPSAIRLSKTKRVWLLSDIENWILSMHKLNMEGHYGSHR